MTPAQFQKHAYHAHVGRGFLAMARGLASSSGRRRVGLASRRFASIETDQ
jgi:hypothetical protein